MIAVAIVAIWLFIISQGIRYQARHFGHHSGWDRAR